MVVEGGEGRTGFWHADTIFKRAKSRRNCCHDFFRLFTLKCWSTKSVLLSLKMQLFGKFEIMFNAEYSVWTVMVAIVVKDSMASRRTLYQHRIENYGSTKSFGTRMAYQSGGH